MRPCACSRNKSPGVIVHELSPCLGRAINIETSRELLAHNGAVADPPLEKLYSTLHKVRDIDRACRVNFQAPF